MLNRSKTVRCTAMLLLGAVACSSIVDPALDPRAVPFQPPPVYARWWSMVQSCSGLQGSLSDVSWYQVPGSGTVSYSGDEVAGYWALKDSRIVLGGEAVLDGSVVRHEMLHALVRKASGHPREYFLQRCAGLVVCGPTCVADGGPPPNIDATVQRPAFQSQQIISEFPAVPARAPQGLIPNRFYSGTHSESLLNGGGNKIVLHTSLGKITIRKNN